MKNILVIESTTILDDFENPSAQSFVLTEHQLQQYMDLLDQQSKLFKSDDDEEEKEFDETADEVLCDKMFDLRAANDHLVPTHHVLLVIYQGSHMTVKTSKIAEMAIGTIVG